MSGTQEKPSLEAFLDRASQREPKLVFNCYRHAQHGQLVVDMHDELAGDRAAFAIIGNRAVPVEPRDEPDAREEAS